MNIISINFKTAPIEIRSLFAFNNEETISFCNSFFINITDVKQCVVLSTCNRCEIYFDGDKSAIKKAEEFLCKYKNIAIEDVKKYFNIYKGDSAIGHLLKVACGIESMVLGEDEILRQVKESYSLSLENGFTSFEFNTIFKMAITAAKEIKTCTGLSKTPVSIGTLCANEVFSFPKEQKNVLIIGITGKMGSIAAKNISAKPNITLCGTSGRRSASSCTSYSDNISIFDFKERYKLMNNADIIISATSSPHYTVTKSDFLNNVSISKPRLFIDLAVPNDIDSSISSIEGYSLFDIDYFNHLAKSNNDLKYKEAISAGEYTEKWKDDILKELEFRHILDNMDELEKITDERSIKHLIYSLRKLADRQQVDSISKWLDDYIKEWRR